LGATVWSDDFEDKDYNGWTVAQGTFSAAEKALKAETGNSYIYHFSSVAYGTWSFDVYMANEVLPISIDFMMEQANTAYGSRGYEIIVDSTDMIDLRIITDSNRIITQTILKEKASGWVHMDITRDENGRFCVFVKGECVIDVVEPSITTSEYFGFYNSLSNAAIDNIVVSNTVDIQPPPQTPLWLQPWFLMIAGVVVFVTVSIVFLRRRKQ
jgi:hypothetical protein